MERYKKCRKSVNKSAHARNKCMAGVENLPLPDEIIVQILGYLSLGELIQCATVSKSWYSCSLVDPKGPLFVTFFESTNNGSFFGHFSVH